MMGDHRSEEALSWCVMNSYVEVRGSAFWVGTLLLSDTPTQRPVSASTSHQRSWDPVSQSSSQCLHRPYSVSHLSRTLVFSLQLTETENPRLLSVQLRRNYQIYWWHWNSPLVFPLWLSLQVRWNFLIPTRTCHMSSSTTRRRPTCLCCRPASMETCPLPRGSWRRDATPTSATTGAARACT